MDSTGVGVFLVGTLAVLVVPGPSVLFAVTRTLEAGRTAGLVSVLGLEVALALHVTAATTGLGVMVAASPVALAAVRHAGAGYLALLALGQLRTPGRTGGALPGEPHVGSRRGRGLVNACLVDLLNPGTALFLVAFLPQFVDTRSGSPAVQLLQLGVLVVVVATLCDTAWVLVTARLAGRTWGLRQLAAGTPSARRVVAGIYLALAGLGLLG